MEHPKFLSSVSACEKYLKSIFRSDINAHSFFNFLVETSMLGEYEAAVPEYDNFVGNTR